MLVRHRSMQPRPGAHALRRQQGTAHGHEEELDAGSYGVDALTRESSEIVPLRQRHRSKNCHTIRKYGNRLFLRRRQRNEQRVVVEDIECMREALVAMDRQLTLLDSVLVNKRQNAESAAMQLLTTYFNHMKHGLNPEEVEYDRTITKPFLEAAFMHDVKCQDYTGLPHFFQQWEYVTKFHQQVTMTNQFMSPLPADSDAHGNDVYVIKTAGLTKCMISRDTIKHFFPHVLHDDKLVQWLIGKEYEYGYTMILHLNNDGRVFQFESQIDLMSGLLALLSDPMVTLQLIESSMWTKCGNLRGEVQEEQVPIENGFLA